MHRYIWVFIYWTPHQNTMQQQTKQKRVLCIEHWSWIRLWKRTYHRIAGRKSSFLSSSPSKQYRHFTLTRIDYIPLTEVQTSFISIDRASIVIVPNKILAIKVYLDIGSLKLLRRIGVEEKKRRCKQIDGNDKQEKIPIDHLFNPLKITVFVSLGFISARVFVVAK